MSINIIVAIAGICLTDLCYISYKGLSNILLSRLIPYIDEIIGDHQCGFRRKRSLLIRFSAFVRYWKKWEYKETVHQLLMDLKKAYYSERWEVLYNILTEFGVPMKLVGLIKMCLNGT
jgi:hypothetical protein